MSTSTRRRRRRFAKSEPVGKLAYRVLGPGGAELKIAPFKQIGLVLAQGHASNATDAGEWIVCSDPVFGERHLLYRVVRDEDGIVTTYVVSEED